MPSQLTSQHGMNKHNATCDATRGTQKCQTVLVGTQFIRKYQTCPRVRKDAAQSSAALLHAD